MIFVNVYGEILVPVLLTVCHNPPREHFCAERATQGF
ncbi:hypothetical protein ATJ97_1497 [Georgenia soli]|uniref:Uncharacterized protein n=1 Tax=Georgenia soli TaxID=638953 RepID=A0A2A9EJK6_9MICO|nr:hypothetical protein ATJ97_1497 [Georgenia soli]